LKNSYNACPARNLGVQD